MLLQIFYQDKTSLLLNIFSFFVKKWYDFSLAFLNESLL